MNTLTRWLLVALLAAAFPGASSAAEKWADARLPVAEGLEVWLDATTLPAASGANGVSPPRAGGGVGVWYDGSGKKRDARQDAPGKRPQWRVDLAEPQADFGELSRVAVIQFDGRDDTLVAEVAGLNLRDFTVFVVGAPFSNQGMFRALLAVNERGKNDYTTGINIDLGPGGSGAFEQVNVEGRGFSGARDLLSDGASFPFGTFHVLALTSNAGGQVRLVADAKPQAERPRTGDPITPDELRVGARWANPGPNNAGETGYFDGAFAEVLVYRRKLSDADRAKVERYLRDKHAPLLALKGVPSRPPVQMLVPGFTVRELPVKLPNLTAIRYGPDGKLYGAGYDGRMHVLSDTDGDGLEDKAEVLWDKAPFRTPMAFTWAPDGTMYVTSNGRISALRDTDGDGKPDKDEVVNTGWPPDAGFTGGGVDAMGLVFDKQGNFYFGLGCTLFANAYLVDEKTDKARYDIKSERGTILKVSPDGKKREIVCTGIRFPVGLAMNRYGDLFCTDQEGATWLEGGNPLDELNHIVPGKHYGFPQKNEKYLPDVVDEPPAVTFGPQHQSTCGLIFNEPTEKRPATFGPESWEDNAIVCGYSRGKLWRVPLVKTEKGYVGRPHLLASFRVLTLEPAIDPQGNLTIITHSGEPDWGTGPGGSGRIFEISYTDPKAPQPALAWAEGPTDVRVAFDRPVESNFLGDLTKVHITYGEFVRAGDRFEVLKPPYEVVAQQARAYRGELRVTAAKLSDDRRTLLLTTDPHPMQAWYAVSIPLAGGPLPDGQERVIEVDYDLTGVEGAWAPDSTEEPTWRGWLPDRDQNVSRTLTAGSAYHDQLWALMKRPGMVIIGKGREEQSPHVAYRSDHTIARYPPWVPTALPAPPPAKDSSADHLAGGDWKRGQALFFGAEANCHTCHVIRGQGGHIGPDLSNLPHRDLASLYRDITEPNAVINPDHRGYTARLVDGTVLSGLIRSDSADKLRVYDTAGKETVVSRAQVKQLRADAISIMPEGYAKLGEQKIRDLLAFLTSATPQTQSAPQAGRLNAAGAAQAPELLKPLREGRVRESGGNRPPPVRTRAEVNAVLGKSEKADPANLRPLRILLVAGKKDHGPGEHDYPQWQKDWEPLVKKLPKVQVSTAFGRPDSKQWETADLMVFYCWGPQFWDDESYKQLDGLLARGGGVVLLHSATIADNADAFAQRVGVCYRPLIKFRHGPVDLNVPSAAKDHPVMRGFGTVPQVDESYWPHVGAGDVTILATTPEEGEERAMAWATRRRKGRVFGTLLGHYTWTFDDPLARVLILRGMAWAAGEPAGRFEVLATEGVELKQ